HRGVDAAREAADGLARADLLADGRDGVLGEGARGPVRRHTGDVEEEGAQQLDAARGVGDLGVELDAEDAPLEVADRGEGAVVAAGDDVEAGGQRGDAVAMAHPDVDERVDLEAVEDAIGLRHGEAGRAVLALVGALYLAAQEATEELHAVA